jgi:phenylalanyl-tRNA synthetase beta subunit
MDLDNAAAFMLGTIAYGVGVLVLVSVVVAINNVISNYWKPVRIFTADSWNINPPVRFATQEEAERITPTLESTNANNARANG